MSAFMVDHIHIDALVTWAAEHRIRYRHNDRVFEVHHQNQQEVGEMLLRENERSVCYRYPDCVSNPENMPGRIGETVENYRFSLFPCELTAVELIKLCGCYEYQACETNDWEDSQAHALIQSMVSHAVHELPGYQAAPWGISQETLKDLKHGNMRRMTLFR